MSKNRNTNKRKSEILLLNNDINILLLFIFIKILSGKEFSKLLLKDKVYTFLFS